jgi:hypothetical protein
MRRKFVIVLLALGTVVGYGAGIHSVRHHGQWGQCAGWHHDQQQQPQP